MLLLFMLLLFLAGACAILIAASPLGRADLPHISRGADGELSGDACAGVGVFQCIASSMDQPKRRPETAPSRLHALAGARRLRAGVHSGCGASPAHSLRGPRPVANRRVVHLPVLLAGAAAWVLGMAWHSEYLFRPRWMMALGLSDAQTRA